MGRRNKGKYGFFPHVHFGEHSGGGYFDMMSPMIGDVVLIIIAMIMS
jgi:hypothetical protein